MATNAKRTLLVVIGAGASMPAGVPGVADVTRQIDTYLPSTAVAGSLASSPAHPLSLVFPWAYGDAFRSAVHAYFDNTSRGTTHTFENILSALEELDDWKFELSFMSRLTEFKPALPILPSMPVQGWREIDSSHMFTR